MVRRLLLPDPVLGPRHFNREAVMRNAIRLGTLAIGLVGCGTIEPGSEDVELAPRRQPLLAATTTATATATLGPSITIGNPDTSTVTFFSEAALVGDSLTRQVTPSSLNETVKPITSVDIQNANLTRRISSIRLVCGTRASDITVLNAANAGTDTSAWSAAGLGFTLTCNPGQTVTANLHTQAPNLADAVGSAYFLVHASHKSQILFSTVVASNFNSSSFPDGVTAPSSVELRMWNSDEFSLHQDFQLDAAACEARGGYITLLAVINSQQKFITVFVTDAFVGDGLGDVLGCHDQMLNALQKGANDAASQLTSALTGLMQLAGNHTRYYFAPVFGLSEFALAAGGDPSVQAVGVNL
jgi:hypothetical protein